jgi:LEA14-like dessication related protein
MRQINKMVKTFRNLFAVLASVLILGSIQCNNPVQAPTFVKVKDTKVSGFSITNAKAKMSATLVFNNPNAFGVKAKDANLKLYIEDTYVGDVMQAAAIDVPAKSEFNLPILADFDLKKSLGSMMGLLGKKQLKYKIDGTIRVGKADVFVSVPVKVEDALDMASLGL